MRRFRWCAVVAFACALAAGCGESKLIKAKGHIVWGGAPFKPEQGEGLRLFFCPAEAQSQTYDSYMARFSSKSGEFEVVGKDGNGMPPGKYRVSMQLMKNKEDLFNGKLFGAGSPFLFDVSRDTGELTLDLDQVPGLARVDPSAVKRGKKRA